MPMRYERMVSNMDEDTIKNIKAYLVGGRATPILYVEGEHDPTYKSMRDMVKQVYPKRGDNMYDTQRGMQSILATIRHMEAHDYAKIINTIKKYEVEGTNNGIRGRRTYGYDASRLDRKMYRRKRPN